MIRTLGPVSSTASSAYETDQGRPRRGHCRNHLVVQHAVYLPRVRGGCAGCPRIPRVSLFHSRRNGICWLEAKGEAREEQCGCKPENATWSDGGHREGVREDGREWTTRAKRKTKSRHLSFSNSHVHVLREITSHAHKLPLFPNGSLRYSLLHIYNTSNYLGVNLLQIDLLVDPVVQDRCVLNNALREPAA